MMPIFFLSSYVFFVTAQPASTVWNKSDYQKKVKRM